MPSQMNEPADSPESAFELVMDDGAQIALRRAGNPDGTRLFISHGNGFAVDGYRVFWEPLLRSFDVILFDMRNHGRSGRCGAEGHNYRQFCRDLGCIFRGVEERFGHKPSVGVFHSTSARVALKHAAEVEWIWDALVLFDPPNIPFRGHPALHQAMRTFGLRMAKWASKRPDRFGAIDELRQLLATSRTNQRWAEQSFGDMSRAILRPDGANNFSLTCRRELEASIYLAGLTIDLWPAASALGGPVKLIGADPKVSGPAGLANEALAKEGGYDYEIVPDAGHVLQLERPQACRDAMLSFLHGHGLA